MQLEHCRYNGKHNKGSGVLHYYDAFNRSEHKPYKFIVWCRDLTQKYLDRYCKDGDDRRRILANLRYLDSFVKMGDYANVSS